MRTRKSTSVLVGLIVALAFVFSAIGVPDAMAAKTKYNITVTQPTGGGSITPKGKAGIVKATEGKNSIFTIKPPKDYHVASVTIDNAAIELTDTNLTRVGTSNVYKYKFSTVSAVHSITAAWEADETFTILVAPTGTGLVTSSPGGIKCGGTQVACSMDVKEGRTVTLTAKPQKSGSVTWAGCTQVAGNANKCTVSSIAADTEVSADFEGGAAGSASAMKIAEKVSVVEAKDTSAQVPSLKIARSVSRAAIADLSATSDYNKDKTFTFVNERSIEVFDTINEILCMMSQAKYDEMLNKGNYIAQIDESQCSNDKDSAESAGESSQDQTSGSDAVSYMQWTINSTRDSATSPQIVKAWIHEEGGDMDKAAVIYTQTTIYAGVSEENPYGDFEMHFKFYPLNNDGTIAASPAGGEKGFIKTVKLGNGKVALTFASDGDHGDFSYKQRAVLNRAKDGLSGVGRLYSEESGPEFENEAQFDIAFNTDYFYRDAIGESALCLDRSAFEETAWRYGLYNAADGSRVKRNSGFPVKFHDDVKDRDYHGWVGYGGLWFPNDVQIQSGQIVKKFTYTPGEKPSEESFEVIISNGKLKKHVRKLLTLEDIKNIPLQYHEQSFSEGPGGGPGVEYRVIWDGTDFKKVASMQHTQDGPPVWTDITAETMNVTENVTMPELNFWSQSLGGQVRVKLDCQMPKFEGAGGPASYACTNKTTQAHIDLGMACADRDNSTCLSGDKAVDLGMICGNMVGGDLKCINKTTQAVISRDDACWNKDTSSCTDPSGKSIELSTLCNTQAPGAYMCTDSKTQSIIPFDQACVNKTTSSCMASGKPVDLANACTGSEKPFFACNNKFDGMMISLDMACSSKDTSECKDSATQATADLNMICGQQQPAGGVMCKNKSTGFIIPFDQACVTKDQSECKDTANNTLVNLGTACPQQTGGMACKNITNGTPITKEQACVPASRPTSECKDPMTNMIVKIDDYFCGGGSMLACKNTTNSMPITKDMACMDKTHSSCTQDGQTVDLATSCPTGDSTQPPAGFGLLCKNTTTSAILTKDQACANKSTSSCINDQSQPVDLNMVCTQQPAGGNIIVQCKLNGSDQNAEPKTVCQSITPGVQPNYSCTSNGAAVTEWQTFCSQVLAQPAPQVEGFMAPPSFSCNAPSDTSVVIFYSENMVYPTDTVPTKLRCYDNCPKLENGMVVTQMMNFDPSKVLETTATNYTFDSSAMVLKDTSGNQVVQSGASGDSFDFGAMSGPLFDPDNAANMAALKCGDMMSDDASKNGFCPWKAWSELEVFYTWETGNNNWNKFTALKKDGAFLTFDPPLQVQYTHSETGNKYHGSKFYLEYAGFGDLHGIPGTCVDFNTGEKISCGPNTRWIPEFSIPAGTEVIDGSDSSKKYYVKPLEREQRMKKVESSVCEAAGLEFEELPLPVMSTWKDPKIGDEPIIMSAPAVIGGVVQGSTAQ